MSKSTEKDYSGNGQQKRCWIVAVKCNEFLSMTSIAKLQSEYIIEKVYFNVVKLYSTEKYW